MSNKNVIIIGAGGHSKVIADIVLKNNDNIIGFLDDNKNKKEIIIDKYEVVGKIEDINEFENDNIEFIIAIGNNEIRRNIAKKYKVKYYKAIHHTAQIGLEVMIGCGTAIMANVVINANTVIGTHCIINSSAVVEHDCNIDNFSHIASNATIAGGVIIKELSHIKNGEIVERK